MKTEISSFQEDIQYSDLFFDVGKTFPCTKL